MAGGSRSGGGLFRDLSFGKSLEPGFEFRFGGQADHSVHDPAGLEKQEGGNALNVETPGERRGLVHVDLYELDLGCERRRQSVQHWGEAFAGAAPRGVKIHDHRVRRLEDLDLEL